MAKTVKLCSVLYRFLGVIGGGGRDRTDDLKLAKLPLSQLSYAPTEIIIAKSAKVVGQGRFELPTSPLSGVRSNQLSYRPKVSHWLLLAIR